MKNVIISLLFCITNFSFFVLWIVFFLKINLCTNLLQNFNHFRCINFIITLAFIIICIFIFKLNFDKLFLRFNDGEKLPILDKILLLAGIQLILAFFIIGFIYSIYLNLTGQEMTQMISLRLFDLPFLILINYLAFIVEYLSFRYFLLHI